MKNSKTTRLPLSQVNKLRGSTNWARMIQEENSEKDDEKTIKSEDKNRP
jgi:hypothetical protein